MFLFVMILTTAVLGFAYMRYGKDNIAQNGDNTILNILQNSLRGNLKKNTLFLQAKF